MHYAGMRTHKQIIQTAGAQAVIDRAGLGVSIHTVRSWQQRNRIPAEYWPAIAEAGLAPMPDLIAANLPRRASPATPFLEVPHAPDR